ncbi:MAG: VPLPA-CTERM sorting domain-containing protein [Paracoccus sp. (in: a-proteobacteria)]|uniref:VPLPA-CTERM sorting domain-containing protein n=1 Tax=Paracoccus sp. TaxID=267 RepID=UPI0026E0237B|nr:VPLPA-CTERM sorting domain-containing protein [Paracoccus sp. (in: a-proteobacteria)]MDO5613504.1 VPLPA-CTERM sorting domain-containing protein [Paracoccus sp. (in: a-proteobacteria)]
MAQAATYQGHFDEGYIWGSFAGIDRNGDGRITPDELTGFSATLDNMTGGPGQYRVESKSVSNFLFVHHGPGKATLSGTVSFWFRQAVCEYCWGGGYDPYDDAYGFAAMIAPRYSYGEYEVRETLNTSNVSYQLTPATVPLPAGGALLTGGLAALALMRRRGSRPDQQGRG